MRNPIITVSILASLFAFTACDDGWSTTPLPPPGNTPTEVLMSLVEAFNDRDIDKLDRALADDFTFHFDPLDVGYDVGGYIIPETMGRDDFLASCGNMLAEAYSIDSDVAFEYVGEPDDGATEYMADTIYVCLYVMIDPEIYCVAQDVCDFRFVDRGDDTDDWVITDWWDDSVYGTFESEYHVSLGWLLAWYAE